MISFACRHCGAPQTAESEDFAAIAVCYECHRMALRDDATAKARVGLPTKPAPEPSPKLPSMVSVKLMYGIPYGFGFGIGFFAAGIFLCIVAAVIGMTLMCGGIGPALDRAAPRTSMKQ